MDIKQEKLQLLNSRVYKYHQFTKHTVEKLYSGGHYLDWANQPDPFLVFKDTVSIELLRKIVSTTSTLDLTIQNFYLDSSFSNREKEKLEIELDNAEFISNLLYYSMAISAWKEIKGTENRWALRVNASSGNLHPTETSILIGRDFSNSIKPGFYHYDVAHHSLETRTNKDILANVWKLLGFNTPPPPVLVCLSSIFWREAWKYRDRAFRYCQLDLGHALGAVSIAATSLNWQSFILSLFPDQKAKELLGYSNSQEVPLAFVALAPIDCENFDSNMLGRSNNESVDSQVSYEFSGSPSSVSDETIVYESIEEAYKATLYELDQFNSVINRLACQKDQLIIDTKPDSINSVSDSIVINLEDCESSKFKHFKNTFETIRKRRSAVSMDGKTGMTKDEFLEILSLSTSGYRADYSIQCELIHLYFYVHRVKGLKPGLYYLNRQTKELHYLSKTDQREIARLSSCFQEIASDGAFSVSMVADFNKAMNWFGERGYSLCHNQAGFVGQFLYLSTFATGYDATGIGCFIDDIINEYLGLKSGFEVVYNFTVGRAVNDDRLTTKPAYDFCD